MRIDEGTLRAWLDDALSPTEREAVAHYLAGSAEARATLAWLSQDRADFALKLETLAPPATELPAAPQALKRFYAEAAPQEASFTPVSIKERIDRMFNNPFVKKYQPILSALAVIAVLSALFSFAPVRAIAGNLLQIFRVQDVKVVPIDEDKFESRENKAEIQGLLDKFNPEQNIVSGGGDPQIVDSVAEAAGLVDFPIARLTDQPEADEVSVYEKTVAEIMLDKELLDALFEAAKIDVTLPDSIEDSPMVLTMPATVAQKWGPDDDPSLTMLQLRSPQVEYPADLDLNALGVAGLQLLGMDEAEAVSLGASIDWANTLVLPIPQDDDVNISEVDVNGATGYLFVDTDYEIVHSSVMWTQNGLTYFLEGRQSADKIIELARSVK